MIRTVRHYAKDGGPVRWVWVWVSSDCGICVPVCVCVCVCAQSLSHVHLCNPMDYSPPDSLFTEFSRQEYWSVVAIYFSRGSSWPRDQTHVFCISCTGRRILYYWATWKAQITIIWGVFSYVKLSLIPTGAEYCFFLVFLSRPAYVSLYFHNNKVKRK